MFIFISFVAISRRWMIPTCYIPVVENSCVGPSTIINWNPLWLHWKEKWQSSITILLSNIFMPGALNPPLLAQRRRKQQGEELMVVRNQSAETSQAGENNHTSSDHNSFSEKSEHFLGRTHRSMSKAQTKWTRGNFYHRKLRVVHVVCCDLRLKVWQIVKRGTQPQSRGYPE